MSYRFAGNPARRSGRRQREKDALTLQRIRPDLPQKLFIYIMSTYEYIYDEMLGWVDGKTKTNKQERSFGRTCEPLKL